MRNISLRFTRFTMQLLSILLVAAGAAWCNVPTELWVARYNGPGNSGDFAKAMALDESGNVYVTGYSAGNGTGTDYCTIKYDSDGNQVWLARYNGPGNSTDWAYAIAVDSSGNVYVTGTSYGGTDYDSATIKYDSAGNQVWLARYDSGLGGDYASAIAVDGSGNVYVTGSDYVTIKYDSAGNQLWAARYNGPWGNDRAYDIALDGSGNVYVTGFSARSGTRNDCATIKYDSAGNQVWAARYSGPGDSTYGASSIALDGSGNIYVTGAGSQAYPAYGYLIAVKYDSAGNQVWLARWGSANGFGNSYAMAVDPSGNVYATGYYSFAGGTVDYRTIKYDSAGSVIWSAGYNGAWNHADWGYAMALDGSGNVYVTGESSGFNTNSDYATVKYDSAGNQIWVARYNNPWNYGDAAVAIALDSHGNVYVTGGSNGNYGGVNASDYVTIKYCQGPPAMPTVNCTSGQIAGNWSENQAFTFTFSSDGATGYEYKWDTSSTASGTGTSVTSPYSFSSGNVEGYYYHVRAGNACGWGDYSNLGPFSVDTGPNNIGSIRGAPVTGLTLRGIVTAKFASFMYVESEDRSSGARVTTAPSGIAVGDRVRFVGDTALVDGQKQITPTSTISALSSGNPLPYLGIRNRDIGGHDYGVYDPGVTNGRGALNVGLIVKVHGIVTYRDTAGTPAYFYIWDGGNRTIAPVNDGNSAGAWGVRIAHSGLINSTAVVPWTDWVEIEGIVSVNTTAVSGSTIPEILPSVEPVRLTAADFTTVNFPAGTILAGKNLVGVPYSPGNVGNGDPSGCYQAYDPVDVFGPSYTGDWLADAEAIDGRIIRWDCEAASSVGFDMWKPQEFGGAILGDGYWLTAPSDWTTCSYKARVQNIAQWFSPGGIGKVELANPQDHAVLLDPANMDPPQDPATGVQMSDGGQVKSFYDASTYGAGWIQSTGLWWDNAAGSLRDTGVVEDWAYDDFLRPWHGYSFTWLQNYKSMIVP